jgi:hypothetical protein
LALVRSDHDSTRVKAAAVVLAGLAIVLAIMVLVAPSKGRPVESADAIIRLQMDRDFATSAKQLLDDSDAVVMGQLLDRSTVHSVSSDGYITHLAQDFQVQETLKGDVAVNAVLPLLVSIRSSDKAPVVEGDAAPLDGGSRYVLFLRWEDDIYVSTGGPQGQFLMADGRLRPATMSMPAVSSFQDLTIKELRQLLETF